MDDIKREIIPEMSHPTSVCPNPERWHAIDDMATELEVLEFLRALVVMIKPDVSLETGCYKGYGSEAILKGIVENGAGILFACDLGNNEVQTTHAKLKAVSDPCYSFVLHQCSGVELIEKVPGPVNFAFLDSGPDEIRCHELRALYPKLAPGAVVAIHDSGIQGFLREKYLPPLLRELDMQHIFFDTPRGLCLCRKRPEIYP